MLMLENKIALVTGASRGIGYEVCKRLAEEGACVYAGVRNLEKFHCDSSKFAGRIIPVFFDVCDQKSIKACIKQIKDDAGKLDILVNNAGITILERLEMVSDTSIDQIYNTNVFGLIDTTKIAVRLLKKSNTPCIVNISSIMAKESDIGQTVYAGTKAAVESMTRTWTKEYSSEGIRVNAVAPGNVNTDMFNIISEEGRKAEISKIGLGRVAEPEEIANVVLFLASDLSSYVTGEVIGVNGGLVL
ncbi:MAG: SDR family oxidoreductase [Oribacterium sp.]|nr:SDR family oxidoreductase [Oribacterium sp.]